MMNEKCPYCQREMEIGYISSDRYTLKWVSDEKSNLFDRSKNIKLTNMDRGYINVYHCPVCRKMIFDVKQ